MRQDRFTAIAIVAGLGCLVATAAPTPAPQTSSESAPKPTPTPRSKKKVDSGPARKGGTPAVASEGGSLGDIARRTREEKKGEPKKGTLVITNESLRKGSEKPAKGGGSVQVVGRSSDHPEATPTPTFAISEYRDNQGRTEADWRRMMATARERATRAEEDVKRLEPEVRRLENDFYAWSDGSYRERVIKPAWDQAREDLRKAQEELDQSRSAQADLEEEARKSGALPGWLR